VAAGHSAQDPNVEFTLAISLQRRICRSAMPGRVNLMLSICLSLALLCPGAVVIQDPVVTRVSSAREMIKQQKYNDAISLLEQILEQRPESADALSLLATSYMYTTHDFLKTLTRFQDAFKSGGYALFWVSHSHEKLGTSELADYCRGWLYLRANEVEFAPEKSDHGFRLSYSQIQEVAQNKVSKRLFHIKDSTRTYNFRPRSGEESEVMLVVALYKKRSK
jgi:tetratricopeptide (TPR) repeat protein